MRFRSQNYGHKIKNDDTKRKKKSYSRGYKICIHSYKIVKFMRFQNEVKMMR